WGVGRSVFLKLEKPDPTGKLEVMCIRNQCLSRQKGDVYPQWARPLRDLTRGTKNVTQGYCPRMRGSPFLLFPITTTLLLELFARLSVASMPFHSKSCGLIPWATICWKSRIPCASMRLRCASCVSFCRRKLMAKASCSACCLASMEDFRVAGS